MLRQSQMCIRILTLLYLERMVWGRPPQKNSLMKLQKHYS
nr:MAG TPA: hypothetical protein [Caudoviricetes sp.]